MEKQLTYYDFAMNDYLYLRDSVKAGLVYNGICSAAQNCIERFLKHVIEPYATERNDTAIMRTHDLAALKSFVTYYIPEFRCNWGMVMLANGFYFSARHPGDNAFFVRKQDVEDCWGALCEAKRAVDAYMRTEEWERTCASLHPSREEVKDAVGEVLSGLEGKHYGHLSR